MLESSLLLQYRRDSNILRDSFATLLFKAFHEGKNDLRWIHSRQTNVRMSPFFDKLMFRKRLMLVDVIDLEPEQEKDGR